MVIRGGAVRGVQQGMGCERVRGKGGLCIKLTDDGDERQEGIPGEGKRTDQERHQTR